MKRFLLFFLLIFGLFCNVIAQNDQLSTRRYEYIADVRVYKDPDGRSAYQSPESLGLYRLYTCSTYYIDQYGVKQYKWEKEGLYLKDTNGSFYHVYYNYKSPNFSNNYKNYSYPHKCEGFDNTYFFRY